MVFAIWGGIYCIMRYVMDAGLRGMMVPVEKYLGLPIFLSASYLIGVWISVARSLVGADPLRFSLLPVLMMLSLIVLGSDVYCSALFYQRYRYPTPPKPVPYTSSESPWREEALSAGVETEISKILSNQRRRAVATPFMGELTLKAAPSRRGRKVKAQDVQLQDETALYAETPIAERPEI